MRYQPHQTDAVFPRTVVQISAELNVSFLVFITPVSKSTIILWSFVKTIDHSSCVRQKMETFAG